MTDDVSQNGVFTETANSDRQATGPAATETVPPEAIDELFNLADVDAQIAAIARTLDRHRQQLMLLWMLALLGAGVFTYAKVMELRRDA